jgi:YfiH family protein
VSAKVSPPYNLSMWLEEESGGISVFRPADSPSGLLIAFSGRGSAPEGEPSPTAFLARRFAAALGRPELPIVRATQVHGDRTAMVREPLAPGAVANAGPCDVLVTAREGVALAVQTADCVAIALAGRHAVCVVHAGWRGSAKNVTGAAVRALAGLGEEPRNLRAWMGPSIGRCCYEVGGEVAAQFPSDFLRASGDGHFRLDLPGVNRAQLEQAGVPQSNISAHSACTLCSGEKFASYRRDGERAGRMIGLIARFARAEAGSR